MPLLPCHRGRTLLRIGRHSAAVLYAAMLACEPGASPGAGDQGETRGAFEMASGIARVHDSVDDSTPRIVPLAPMTGDVEILLGDPEAPGKPFVMRIRELPGTRVPVHSHPVDEHITVVSGTWLFGIGESWDSTALREMKAGAYAFAPAGSMMFASSPEGAVVQVHGIGPFHITWRHGSTTLDDPGGETRFRFRKGDAVSGPRGPGTVRQGYASGDIVQYEIVALDGALTMADEAELHPN